MAYSPDTLLADLEFSPRIISLLHDAKLYTVAQVATISDADLLRIKRFGLRSLREVRDMIPPAGGPGYRDENLLERTIRRVVREELGEAIYLVVCRLAGKA